uniref:IS66 family insertion sequence element accessory protein TnpB n=2 Tax=Bradyrhizobium quebecense TaxID=2748629 RepID=A0ABS3MM58_9BRAD
MIKHRMLFKQAKPLTDRLLEEVARLRNCADQMPACPKCDAILRKAREHQVTAHMADGLDRPGLGAQLSRRPSSYPVEASTQDAMKGVAVVFRAKRADRVKIVVWDGSGLVMYRKRLDGGRFMSSHRGRRHAGECRAAVRASGRH